MERKYIIDDEYKKFLSKYNWKYEPITGYWRTWRKCNCNEKGGATISMHKLLMNYITLPEDICLCDNSYVMEGYHIDHINNDRNDNRIENLQFVLRGYNLSKKNREKYTSKYNGVSWCKKVSKWESRGYRKGSKKFLGYFDDEKEAALAYDNYTKKYGLDRVINF